MSGGDTYPCKEVISGIGTVHAKIYAYPDGGSEIVIYEPPGRSGDRVERENLPMIWRKEGFPHGCPRSAYIVGAEDVFGRVTCWGLERRRCPFVALADRVENSIRNGRRAASQVRRLARMNRLRYMTTLTVPAGDRSRGALIKLWRAFLRTEGGRRVFRFGALAVVEPHKSGGYHLHVLHPNRLPAVLVRSHWTRYLVDLRGYTLPVGTRFVRTHEKDWGDARKAAEYAAKYVGKTFIASDRERVAGQHRYLRTQGLSAPFDLRVYDGWEVAVLSIPNGARVVVSDDVAPQCPVRWLWALAEPPDPLPSIVLI